MRLFVLLGYRINSILSLEKRRSHYIQCIVIGYTTPRTPHSLQEMILLKFSIHNFVLFSIQHQPCLY